MTAAANATAPNAPGRNNYAGCVAAPGQPGAPSLGWDPLSFADPSQVGPRSRRFGACGEDGLRAPALTVKVPERPVVPRRSLLAGLVWPCLSRLAAAAAARPVLEVDVPAPTRDKPQSKLWHARGAWWAWLPVRDGSSLWRRSAAGWRRQSHLEAGLRGLPGQADVWAEGDTACAVLVEARRLAVVRLQWDSGRQTYRQAGEPSLFQMPAPGPPVETATIARDSAGRWWIAYNWQRMMWVRASRTPAGDGWTQPIAVSQSPASADDICALAAWPGSVGVLWSDQDQDAVYFRGHADQAAPESWGPVETAQQGGKTADDHINIAVGKDGTLYVATKNSVDRVDHPQQVLRVRDPHGKWSNYPYAPLTREGQPTRPIVQLGGRPERLFLLHTVGMIGQKPPHSVIVVQTTSPQRIELAGAARTLIDAGTEVNNVTGSKRRLPRRGPWIVLASDAEGRVYEARLDGAPAA